MDPITGAALINTGGALIGGALGSRGSTTAQRGQERLFFSINRRDQINALQKGIRWRVRDAKAAGVHPLAALGAQLGQYTPIHGGSGGGFGATGDVAADAVRFAAAQIAEMVANLDESKSRTRLNNAQADLLAAQAAASTIARAVSPGTPRPTPQSPPGHDVVNPQFTPTISPGFSIRTNPNFSDAQSYEDRYGEVGGSIMGLMNIPADVLYEAAQRKADADYERQLEFRDRTKYSDYFRRK